MTLTLTRIQLEILIRQHYRSMGKNVVIKNIGANGAELEISDIDMTVEQPTSTSTGPQILREGFFI